MPLSNCLIPLQAKLDEVQPYGYQSQPVGALMALMSPENSSATVKARFLQDDGKFKKYQITYVAPDCTPPTDCIATPVAACDDGTSKPITTLPMTIGKCRFSGVIELTIDQFRDLCNFNASEYTMAQIMGKMDMFRRTLDADVLTNVCSYVGAFSDTLATPKDLRLINETTGGVNIIAETEIMSDFSDAGMNIDPIIIGGRSWNVYNRALRGAGVDINGINMGASKPMNAYYDNQLQGICGTADKESAIALAPKIIQMVNFLENVGDFQANAKIDASNALNFLKQGDTYHFGILRDNVTGMYYDFKAIFDPCRASDQKPVWKLSFYTYFDTWQMPLTQCFSAAFTGALKYNLCGYNVGCPA